ncbi:MAG: hypothetical protein AAF636_17530 [Pseudomonadota bacterium]
MVALSDAVAGIGGITFSAVLGLVAQIQSVLIPLTILEALDAVFVYLALSLTEKPEKHPQVNASELRAEFCR